MTIRTYQDPLANMVFDVGGTTYSSYGISEVGPNEYSWWWADTETVTPFVAGSATSLGSAYRTITIVSGTGVTSQDSIDWLEANAVQQVAAKVPNKVVYGDTVLIDLTEDTATEADVAVGKSFHLASGVRTVGTMSATKTTWYGTCSTGQTTAAKVVVCADFVLETGAFISILFTTANTAATPTLNVNNTSAKSIYIGGSAPNSTTNTLKWLANTLITFVYDGTYYRYISARSAATVVSPDGAGAWYGISSTTASTQAKVSTIDNYRLTKGSRVVILFTTANTYQSGPVTLNVNSTGNKNIWYNGVVTGQTNPLLWGANTLIEFVYNGTGYYVISMSSPATSYGTCSTEANVASKSVVCAGFIPTKSSVVAIRFDNEDDSSSALSLDVNSTGAKDVYYKGAQSVSNNLWADGDTVLFMYDGEHYDYLCTGTKPYTLPTASASTLGGVKIGNGLSISNGVLSAGADYVVEDGTANGWAYHKWASGVIEAWGYDSFTSGSGQTSGSWVGYKNTPVTMANGDYYVFCQIDYWNWTKAYVGERTTTNFRVALGSNGSATSTVYFYLYGHYATT